MEPSAHRTRPPRQNTPRGKLLLQNMWRILHLAAAGAGQAATKQRLQHQHQGKALGAVSFCFSTYVDTVHIWEIGIAIFRLSSNAECGAFHGPLVAGQSHQREICDTCGKPDKTRGGSPFGDDTLANSSLPHRFVPTAFWFLMCHSQRTPLANESERSSPAASSPSSARPVCDGVLSPSPRKSGSS